MIQHLPTRSLTIHPLADRLPVRQPESPEARALRASIAELGVTAPLKISKGRIIDGREVWLHAKALGRETVPCVEVPEGDVESIILTSLLCRKHYSKSALAYLAYPSMIAVLEESKQRGRKNTIKVFLPPGSSLRGLAGAKTAEDFAEMLGVSRTLLFLARNIHGHFAKNAEMREHLEPQILSGDLGLGAVLQEIATWNSKKRARACDSEEVSFWKGRFARITDKKCFATWEKATPATRQAISAVLVDAILKTWPAEIVDAIIQACQKK